MQSARSKLNDVARADWMDERRLENSMNKTNQGSMAATNPPEDMLAYAAGYL